MAPAALMPGDCECGARRIEAGDDAFGRPQEAVTYTASVKIGSCDGPGWVDGLATRLFKTADIGTCGTRGINRGDCAVGSPQECVKHKVWVVPQVGSCDGPYRVDAARKKGPRRLGRRT